jgi:hypothetical protein
MTALKFFFLLFFSSLHLCIMAQRPFWQKLSIQFEGKNKHDHQYKRDNNPESLAEYPDFTTWSWGIELDFQINKTLSVESGFVREQFHTSWNIPNKFIGYELFMVGNLIPFRLNVNVPVLKLGKKYLWVNPSGGYIFGLNSTYDILVGSEISHYQSIDGQSVYTRYLRRFNEYNLSRTFGLLECRGQIRYPVSKTLLVYAGCGYAYGYRAIGYTKISYTYKGQLAKNVINENRGTHFYLNIGLRFNIGSLIADH